MLFVHLLHNDSLAANIKSGHHSVARFGVVHPLVYLGFSIDADAVDLTFRIDASSPPGERASTGDLGCRIPYQSSNTLSLVLVHDSAKSCPIDAWSPERNLSRSGGNQC